MVVIFISAIRDSEIRIMLSSEVILTSEFRNAEVRVPSAFRY